MNRDTTNPRQSLLERYQRHYNPPLAIMLRAGRCPLEETAQGHYIVDERGHRYLDFSAGYGVFGLGHLDPDVQRAAQRQLAALAAVPPATRTEARDRLRDLLARLAPGDLDRVVLTGSGSESTEVAQRIAGLARPDRTATVAVTTGYHGKTLGAMAVLGQRHLTDPFLDADASTRFVPFGDLAAIDAAIDADVAAVYLEPVVGGGYVTVPPPGYLAAVARLCAERGALLVVDEVQTGFGRTGTMFGVDHDAVVPDILLVSKAMSGGHVPMSAVLVRARVYAEACGNAGGALPFDTEMGTSPLACAAATAAIEKIVREDLPGNAARLGPYLLTRLRAVAGKYPKLVREVDGRGLMVGVKVANPLVEQAIWLQMIRHGVMTGISMNTVARNPALRIFPPLTVGVDEIDVTVEALDASLTELSRYPAICYRALNHLMRVQYHLPQWFLTYGADVLTSRRTVLRARPPAPRSPVAYVTD
ncbi:class-III pyridoxal-phosphate-dependent aminotransferase [Nocardia blacklockiae]|uniref:class-III pyridoxal-phosphate-dependent aminotransferase n=1 Tax=Nocardia blacklockiae TaxID=480036 RepID=UPI001896258E|nr:aspartate aminotransferase family protein [Nocardia blacklockiae]MBF6169877.1 aspartate aminotransferase family protein [Nocardia blacklockiae]